MKKQILLAILVVFFLSTTCFGGDETQSFSVEAALEINQIQGGAAGFTDSQTVGSYFFDSQKISGHATAENATTTLEAYPYQDSSRTDNFFIDNQGGVNVSISDNSKIMTGAYTSTSSCEQAMIETSAERYGNTTVVVGNDFVATNMNMTSAFEGQVSGENPWLSGESINSKEVKVYGNNFFSQSTGTITIQSGQ